MTIAGEGYRGMVAALEAVDADIRHHTRSDDIPSAALIRRDSMLKVRAALSGAGKAAIDAAAWREFLACAGHLRAARDNFEKNTRTAEFVRVALHLASLQSKDTDNV